MTHIKLNNISLDYFHYTKRNTLKKAMVKSIFSLFGKNEETFELRKAIDGLSVEFNPGDRVALIGKNGSGKSSLLRILSGIYQPTAGSLEVQGSISSLLEIGVGLNMDATGYENIILIGILHGKTRKYMKDQFGDIEAFTELKEYLKLPVGTYSSGMRLRLAFGIATCIHSDILLIDEVIGVGDQSFMEKAQNRLKNLVHKTQILILTSHSTQILHQFCNKSLVLEQGKSIFFGPLQSGIDIYTGTL